MSWEKEREKERERERKGERAYLCARRAPAVVCFEAEVSGGVNAQPGAAPSHPNTLAQSTSSPLIRRTCGGGWVMGDGGRGCVCVYVGVVKQLSNPALHQQRLAPRSIQI